MTQDGSQRLESIQQGVVTTNYSYDSNGNMTVEDVSGTKTTYAYNRENPMQALQAPCGVSTCAFDSDGLRITKQAASGTIVYVWDGSDYLGEIS